MRITVTHTARGEGSTTVAASLAVMFAETGARVTYIDCDMKTRKGYELLKPDIRESEPLLIPGIMGKDSRTGGTLLYGNAWGIDYYGISAESCDERGKREALRKLNSITGHTVTIIDMPENAMNGAEVFRKTGNGIVVTTPETLESGESLEKLNRYNRMWENMLVLINKCRSRISWTGNPASLNGFEVIDRFLFDRRIENMGKKGMLALDHIPAYRPFFGKLVQRILRKGREPVLNQAVEALLEGQVAVNAG